MPSNRSLKAFETKQTRFRANWLKNATRSVGITLNNTLSDVAPNTSEFVNAGAEIARTVASTLRRGRTGIGKINSQLSESSYAKIGQTAINNALNSIKTGKWGEGGDFGLAMPGDDNSGGFSYGDEDIDSSASSAELAGLSSLSDQINKQSIAQIKTAQANMETMISINASRMYQTQQISSEILSHISNMENHLASIVEFNNSTMLKFVEASMGYYEKTGAAITMVSSNDEIPDDDKVKPTNVFKNRKGGIDFNKYKKYIKNNIQKTLDDSGLGIALDEDMLQMLAQDPIGVASQIAAGALINKFAGSTIKGIEDRLSSAIPNALAKLADLRNSDNPIAKFIGNIFGLKGESRNSDLSGIKINKGPIPFDGETKHAITSVITHELRNQTGYLKAIADKVLGENSDKAMRSNREFFNERIGKYERGTDIDLNIAKFIEEGITDAFKGSAFGADLSNFVSGISDDKSREEMSKTLDEFYMGIIKENKDALSLEDMIRIISNLSAPSEAKRLLNDKIKAMYVRNQTNFKAHTVATLSAKEASNDRIKYLRENGSTYHLEESSFMGLNSDETNALIDEVLKRGRGDRDNNIIAEITQDPDMFYEAAQKAANGDSSTLNKIINSLGNLTEKDYNQVINKISHKATNKLKGAKDTITGNGQIDRETIINDVTDLASGRGISSERISGAIDRVGSAGAGFANKVAGGLSSRSGMLSRFFYGDQKKGTKGIFEGIADSFNRGLKQANTNLEMTDGTKAITAGAVGALTGSALASMGFLPAILAGTGPIGGAVAGLTLAIAGAGPAFKRALFGGEEEEFTGDNGKTYKHKKKGLIGRLGTTIEANLINPVRTAAINAITQTSLNIEHAILTPVKYLSMFVAKRMGKAAGKLFDFAKGIGNAFTDENSLLNRLTGGLFKAGVGLAGNAISGGINLASSVGNGLLSLPGNIFGGILNMVDPELGHQFDIDRAGHKANIRNAKLKNKENKKHDKIGKELAKLTGGQYGTDTEEARAYLKYVNPEAYNRLFGEDGKGGKYAGFAAKDTVNEKLVNKSGISVSGDPSKYDPQSQAAIYGARSVVMLEQVVKAILGEKVEIVANDDATINKGSHQSQEEKNEKLKNEIKKRFDNKKENLYKQLENDDLSDEERSKIEEKLQKIDPDNYKIRLKDINSYRTWGAEERYDTAQYRDAMQGGLLSKLVGSMRYSFNHNKRLRAMNRLEEEKLGLRDGNGFGGFGPGDENDEENRHKVELAREQAENARATAIDRATTISEFRERKKEEKDEKWKEKILKAVEGVKVETEEQHKSWTDVFSKKGLITAGLVLAAPLIIKALPSIIDFVKNTGPALMSGIKTTIDIISDAVQSIAGIWGHGIANRQDTDKTGIDNTTGSKINVAANLGRIAYHADDYANLSKQSVRLFKKLRPVKRFAVANNNANRAIGKVFSSIKQIPGKAKGLASKIAGVGADDVASAAINYGDDVMDSAVDLMATAQREGAATVAKYADDAAGAAGKSGLFTKIKGFIGKFYDDILGKFTKKFGSNAPSLKAFAKEKLIDFLQKHFGKVGEKLAAKLSASTASAGLTLGLSEVAFATIGAINGATGAAKLFHVPSDKVDGTMRAISALFGGIAGTTVGGVMDLIFQLFYQFTGVDFLNGIATTLYIAVKKIAGKDEDIEKLGEAQRAMQSEYDEYKNSELKKAYDIQLKTGAIPKELSFEEFVAGVADGTYKANFDSEADYIAKNHGSLGDKMLQGIGKGFKAVGNLGRTYSKYTAVISFETSYTDSNGNTYTQNANGTYDVVSPEGEKLGEIEKNMIPDDAKKNTKVTTAANEWLKLGKKFLEKHNITKDSVKDALNTSISIVKDLKSKKDAFWNNVKEGGINFIRKKTVDRYAIYRPIDNPLSYYKLDKSGNYFDWYNQNGEMIQEKAKTYDEMMDLYGSSLVTKDKAIDGAKLAIKTDASNTLKTIGSTITNIWDKGVSSIKSGLEKAKNFLLGKDNNASDQSTEIDTTISEGGNGGRGSFYSQNDSRWKNSRYGSDATMGDSGCGPTAMAMALSDVTGRNYNPMQMAGLAEATGNRDRTGTNWNFVNTAASAAGVPSIQVYNPGAGFIGSQLASGKELVLSGRTGGYGGFGSAYTPAGHYIVGTGIDRNGIVSYKDPTTGGMGRIPLSMLSAETGSAWALGGRGLDTDMARAEKMYNKNSGKVVNDSSISDYESAQAEKMYMKNANKKSSYTNTISGKSDMGSRYVDDITEGGGLENKGINWIGAVKQAKKLFKNSGKKYSNHGTVMVNGHEYKVRFDCSGLVSLALKIAGLTDPNNKNADAFTSVTFGNGSFIDSLTDKSFFSRVENHEYAKDLRLGDILCYNGHVEVYAGSANGSKPVVYNAGSTDSIQNEGATNSSHSISQLVAVYRPASIYGSSADATVSNTSTASTTGKNTPNNLWNKITGAVSGFFQGALNTLLTGDTSKTWRDFYEDTSSEDSESGSTTHTASSGNEHSGSTGTFGGSTTFSTAATGSSTNKSTIYNYLRSQGLSAIAASGIMGNWAQESSNNPNRFEADYTGIASSMGGLNGIFRNSDSLNEFTQKLFANYRSNGNSINESAYLGKDGNYYPGLGLAQWTGPRGQQLMEFAKSSGRNWNDASTQLDFFMNGPSEFNSKSGLMDSLNNAQSPTDAANIFFDKFEMNRDGYHSSAPAWVHVDKRQANAESIYNEFGGAGRGPSLGRNIGSMSRYGSYGPQYYGGYGLPTSKSDELLTQVVRALETLINVETGASGKLDMLKNVSGSNTNVIVPGNTNNTLYNLETGKGTSTNAISRNARQAEKIAKGGIS